MSDLTQDQAHYTAYPVHPIEITRHLGFCLGSAVKYVLCAPFAGGEEDCEKAVNYLHWEKETPGVHMLPQEAGESLQNIVAFLDGKPGAAVHQIAFLEALRRYLTIRDTRSEREMLFAAVELRVLLREAGQ